MNWDRPKVKGKNKTKEKLKIGEKMTGGPNALGFEYFMALLMPETFRP